MKYPLNLWHRLLHDKSIRQPDLVILLSKSPFPSPSEVFESEVEGSADVLQQTPRSVIAAPPSDDMEPPLVADVAVMSVTGAVDTVGVFVGSVFLQLFRTETISKNAVRDNIFFMWGWFYKTVNI